MKNFKKLITSSSVKSFFEECDNNLIYYIPQYLEFLKQLMPEIEVNYYCLSNSGDKIIALMPLAKKTVEGEGTIINSLPFYGSHGGVLFLKNIENKSQIQSSIIQHILDDTDDENLLSITFVENPFHTFDDDLMNSLGFEVIDHRLGQFKKIAPTLSSYTQEEDLLMSFHSKTRNVVRKGLSFNPEFSEQNDEDTINWLQSVHEKSILKLNGKFKTKEVFITLLKNFPSPNCSRLFVCKLEGKNIAAVLVLLHGTTVEYFTPIIEEEYKHTQLLSSLIYEAMKTLSKEGFELWNWGGTWESQEGVFRFKDRFGSFTMPYRYFSKIKNQAIKQIEKDTLSSYFNFFYSYKFES
jgi:hypothetical protein